MNRFTATKTAPVTQKVRFTVSSIRPQLDAIGVNHLAIGVENVGDEDKYPLTDAQIDADAALVRDLVARFPTSTLLVGHHEVRSLEGTEWFVEQQRRGVVDQGTRQRDALLLATRELARAAACEVTESDDLEHLVASSAPLRAANPIGRRDSAGGLRPW